MIIIIPGQTIAKKNSQRIMRFKNQGRVTRGIAPSEAYKNYSDFSIIQLYRAEKWKGSYPVIVEMFFYRRTKAIFDLDNMQGSVLDILVNAGVLLDDSMDFVIPAIKKNGWDVDKDNPRAEITILEYKKLA